MPNIDITESTKLTATEEQPWEDQRWLSTVEAHNAWKDAIAENDLNSGLSAIQGSKRDRNHKSESLKTQWSLLKASKNKFSDPQNWFWTRKLLEQSSDQWCAEETALDIPPESRVVDVCCGAGADAIAIAKRGLSVLSIDIDPVAIALLEANAKWNGVCVASDLGDAESLKVPPGSFVHVDPDRRTQGGRVTASSAFIPSWDRIAAWQKESCGTSVKVAPATRIPEGVRPEVVRFLSRIRSVRQQRWLWGQTRWPHGSLVVSAFTANRWNHEVFQQDDNSSETNTEMHRGILNTYIGDYDPVIRAADRSTAFAQRIGVPLLGQHGYLSSSKIVVHPMVRWFRVLDTLTMDRKKLVAYSRKTLPAVWELKSRGVEFPLEPLQKQLQRDPSSNRSLTILFTQVNKKNTAIVAEPIVDPGD